MVHGLVVLRQRVDLVIGVADQFAKLLEGGVALGGDEAQLLADLRGARAGEAAGAGGEKFL